MRELLEACGLCFNMIGNRFNLLTESSPPFSWDPLRNWQIVQSSNATRQLRESSIRRWRLWSSRDWVSYALLGFVLAPLIFVGYLTQVIKREAQKREAQIVGQV